MYSESNSEMFRDEIVRESCKARLALGRLPRNLPVVYLVTQVGIWGTGSDDVGLIQSTKAPGQGVGQACVRSSLSLFVCLKVCDTKVYEP